MALGLLDPGEITDALANVTVPFDLRVELHENRERARRFTLRLERAGKLVEQVVAFIRRRGRRLGGTLEPLRSTRGIAWIVFDES